MAKKHKHPGGPIRNPTMQERVERIHQNGITMSDLKYNYDLGYKKGQADGMAFAYDSVYGPMMIALHRVFGFGKQRLERLADAIADVQIKYETNDAAYQQLLKETGMTVIQMREIVEKTML